MENLNKTKGALAEQGEGKLKGIRKFRGILGTFDEKTIQWAIEEAEEI
ncbi:hypothetical protein [Thermococcus camini]|uniref:Uncharacterized protein n=1 Tax=Thermococcus camini TaxID=2016373 RepID=A0A7G2DB62_9EURY|nr:hypothetical protein [Thermococcus camini]CAD5244248.1 conserved protein of unknown function [Thermococcus camini]